MRLWLDGVDPWTHGPNLVARTSDGPESTTGPGSGVVIRSSLSPIHWEGRDHLTTGHRGNE